MKYINYRNNMIIQKFGGTSVGTAVFTATDAAAARTAIDTFSTTESLSLMVALG